MLSTRLLRALPTPRSGRRAGALRRSGRLVRDPSGKVALFVARVLRALRHRADTGASFERVDSMVLDIGGFRASGSMGLDGAPSLVFCDAMPRYSRAIDRPSLGTIEPTKPRLTAGRRST